MSLEERIRWIVRQNNRKIFNFHDIQELLIREYNLKIDVSHIEEILFKMHRRNELGALIDYYVIENVAGNLEMHFNE